MREADFTLLPSPVRNIKTRPAENDEEIQTVDTDTRIVFYPKIDVFLYTESEITWRGEIISSQFVFSYF